jgi:tetratricopeptide (TPR) repeat protein
LAANSDYVEALTGLAMACNHLKQHSEAIEAAGKAVRLNEKQTVAHFALGQGYAAMGDREGALKQVRVLEKLDGKMAEQLKGMISGSATTRKSG